MQEDNKLTLLQKLSARDEFFYWMANAGVQVRVLGLLAGVNKNLRGQMRNFTCKPALQIDASWPLDVENKAISKKFADFAKSPYACAVQQQAKTYGHTALYKSEWERVVSSGTRNMRFQILAHEGFETGMQDPAMAAGATERWRFIWLALCAGCEFSENFGDFTFSQWLLITHPDLFDFILRFVENSVLHLANVGERHLNIVHCAAMDADLYYKCHEEILIKLEKDLQQDWKIIMEDLRPTEEDIENGTVDPHFVQLEALSKKIENGEVNEEDKFVTDTLMLMWLGQIFCDGNLDTDEIDAELYGYQYNAVNIASVTCNLTFLNNFLEVVTRHLEDHHDRTAELENLFTNLCDLHGWNNFHLIVRHQNKLSKTRNIPIETFWNLITEHGANIEYHTNCENSYLPFHMHMHNPQAQKRITKLFFDVLDTHVDENRENKVSEWLSDINEHYEAGDADHNFGHKFSESTVWAVLSGRDDEKELRRRILSKKRYMLDFEENVLISHEVLWLPAWAPPHAQPTIVFPTTAKKEFPMHVAVRYLKFVMEYDKVSAQERADKCFEFLKSIRTTHGYQQAKLLDAGSWNHTPQNAQTLAHNLGLHNFAREIAREIVAAPPPFFEIDYDSPQPFYGHSPQPFYGH